MKNKHKMSNKVKMVNRLRLFLGWFGMLTPVFGAGVLVGVGLMGGITEMFIGQVVVVSAINFYVGRKLLKPVPLPKGKRIKSHG